MNHIRCLIAAFVLLFALRWPARATLRGGDVDPAFNAGLAIYGTIQSIAVQTDGKVLVGGSFYYGTGAQRNSIARLNADGSLDSSFQNGMEGVSSGGTVNSIALQSDGRVVMGGSFGSVNGTNRTSIARLNADGSLDAAFQNGMAGAIFRYCTSLFFCDNYVGQINSVGVQADGKVYVGGYFNLFNSAFHNSIARLNTDGSLDTSFQEVWNGSGIPTVSSLAIQADGKVIIGGSFGIARLNVNGRVDTNFAAMVNGAVYSVALQPNGKVLIGGEFNSVNGVSRLYFARLNTNGILETNLLAAVDNQVFAIAVQTNGKMLIGGDFTSINGVSRGHFARLNSDGSLDGSFQSALAGTDNTVLSFGIQPDSKVIIGGAFLNINGSSFPYLARVYGTAPLFLTSFGAVSNKYDFDLTGESNQVFVVEASTDFVDWTPLITNILGNGRFTFTDSGWRNYPNRFYRARGQ